MKFAWTEKDKERFFKRAERQLKAAGMSYRCWLAMDTRRS